MVKVIQGDVPPEWEIFWKRIVRWYNIKGIPCFSRLWSQKMRRMKKVKYEISDFQSVGTAWAQQSPTVQEAWKSAANKAWAYNRGYRLFTADYIYRLIAGLSVPGTPSDYHQLFGLKMYDQYGMVNPYMQRDDKDVVGPLNFKINIRAVTPFWPDWFKVRIKFIGWYLKSGDLGITDEDYSLTQGQQNWQSLDLDFGVADRQYFHIRFSIELESFEGDVYINNIIMSDKNGVFHNENFITSRNVPWVPSRLYRKKDWYFYPSFTAPHFEHVYLQD